MSYGDKISAAELQKILDYDPETGEFCWRERPREHFARERDCNAWNARFASSIAGRWNQGYCHIQINGKRYCAHRLAWVYMTGEWPIGDIDHKDMNRSNNRFMNLREATRSQNNANIRAQKNNKLGVKGISRIAKSGKYHARIMKNGRQIQIGRFSSIEEARAAYARAAQERFGEFARLD